MEVPPAERPVLEKTDLSLTTIGIQEIPVWGKTGLWLEIDLQPIRCEVHVVSIGKRQCWA